MKSRFLTPLIVLASVASASAGFNVVFEHLLTDADSPLPILKAQDVASQDNETFDGSWIMDSYGGLERYDATRLLLGVRENGINETDAAHDSALAAQFPDRSLIWIDQDTGAPMGVALEIGSVPVPVDQDFLAAGGTENDYYFTFGVDDAGVIYTNHKNRILRYAPKEDGSFEDPTIAYTHANDGSANWQQWRFETLKVSGSGADTVIIAGGKTWRPNQGYREMITDDGLTFKESDNGLAGFKGGGSSIITAPFGDTATQEWMYGSLYPGGSNGKDTSIVRNARDTALDEPFGGNTYRVETDEEIGYQALFISDTEVHPDFPYLVSYSTPSWNSAGEAILLDPPTPGWIAVHDQFYDPEAVDEDGLAKLIGLRKLEATEADELAGATSLFHGTMGELNINVLPGMRPGTAELLWHSGIYGYGRYILDFAPKEIEVTDIARISTEEASLSWTTETGKFYTIETSTDLISWNTASDGIPADESGITTSMIPIADGTQEIYARIGPGKIYAEDFENGAAEWTTGTLDVPFADSGTTQWELGTPTAVGPTAAHSGDNVYGTNLSANYGTLTNLTLTSPIIDLTAVERGSLKFWQFLETSEQEGGQLRILNEAGDSILAESAVFAGAPGDWEEISLSLLNFGDTQNSIVGQKVRLEFRFLSDDLSDGDGAGWHIDTITIE